MITIYHSDVCGDEQIAFCFTCGRPVCMKCRVRCNEPCSMTFCRKHGPTDKKPCPHRLSSTLKELSDIEEIRLTKRGKIETPSLKVLFSRVGMKGHFSTFVGTIIRGEKEMKFDQTKDCIGVDFFYREFEVDPEEFHFYEIQYYHKGWNFRLFKVYDSVLEAIREAEFGVNKACMTTCVIVGANYLNIIQRNWKNESQTKKPPKKGVSEIPFPSGKFTVSYPLSARFVVWKYKKGVDLPVGEYVDNYKTLEEARGSINVQLSKEKNAIWFFTIQSRDTFEVHPIGFENKDLVL